MELVAGRKEEMYWNKVPEKIRMQALEKARRAGTIQVHDNGEGDKSKLGATSGKGRKSKRKRHA